MQLRLFFIVAVALLPTTQAVTEAVADGLSSNFTNTDSLGHGCNEPFLVTSSEEKFTKCPKACPYYVSNARAIETCSFVCVSAEGCEKWNPWAIIADDDMGICRSPSLSHCRKFEPGQDRCQICQGGYHLTQKGHCWPDWAITVPVVGILLIIVVGILAWLIDMARRPITNSHGLEQGLRFRLLSKLHKRQERGHTRQLWPLHTNLCKELPAGPGLCLHMNFQAVIIIWAFCVAIGWTVMAATIDSDLYILGTRKFGTPRENCQLVAWGFETQQRLMWTKVHFTYWVYLLSFIGCMLHSIRQLRNFQTENMETKTMGDFAAFVEGLPEQQGDTFAEENVGAAIEKATDQRVVGVSICWDYHEDAELVETTLLRQVRKMEPPITPSAPEDGRDTDVMEVGNRSAFREKLDAFELSIFHEDISVEEGKDTVAEITETLQKMNSSSNAIVVFETETMRDIAVELSATEGGFEFEGARVTLTAMECEADTIFWQNFGRTSVWLQAWRIVKGMGCILLALALWTLVFYAPYAWSLYTFNYDNGQQPGMAYSLAFTMVVVIGNGTMYEVCSRVADSVCFKFKDPRETLYMILYTVACTFNVLADFILTFVITYETAKGLDFRTFHGVPVEHVTTFSDRFEIYAMQRLLGQNAYSYAFPSTYLIPFLIEPIATIWLPYKLGAIIVRTHPEIQGHEAEDYLMAVQMDMGRYADVILNVLLGIVIFFFPGGYTHTLFYALACSHIWIYIFDHVKVLRSIKTCDFASMEVDWWSQVMLIPCCGLMLVCLIFKANNGEYGYYLEGNWTVVACVVAFFGHFAVHLALLVHVVPLFGREMVEMPDLQGLTYADVNSQEPASWFSTNPIHCLRSEFIYKHDPPCGHMFLGKEYLLKVNEDIGCFFENQIGETPTDDGGIDFAKTKSMLVDFSKGFTTSSPRHDTA